MTSEIDVLKTNEFLRRRKLRLQQVREQSKDIAKKIRQRAKVEKLRNVTDIDVKKEKEYFECQEKLVKRLELIYSKSLENVGASHKKALEISKEPDIDKIDLSKLRGKEAVAEVRKRKQEKLDVQRKLLERKVQAREVANEISREKSSTVTKNLTKQTKKTDNPQNKPVSTSDLINDKEDNGNEDTKKDNHDVTKTDMGTQWESGELPKEWEPDVPVLSLPKDDTDVETIENTAKSDKNKKLNLFALSDEMPSSLRGGLSTVPEETAPIKPSLTLVSEYLQNRNLRLREFEPIKKPADDLQSIKQTILRTRASRTDGSVFDSICHVLDEQLIPVPTWQAEENPSFNNRQHHPSPFSYHLSKFPTNNLHDSSQSNRIKRHLNLNQPKLSSRSNRLSLGRVSVSGNKDKSFRSTDPEVTRKKSISIYNHNTRDVMDVPYREQFVTHDHKTDKDAYFQAFQETASANNMEREKLNKRQQEMRNKVAVTKQNVDKEYRDTLAFLNSLSKDKDINHKKTYMDDQRQKDRNQRKMQQEFKKIEKECHKQNCKHGKRKSTVLDRSRHNSKSPVNIDEQHRKDFEYSWMPVPEGDGNFAIHTIPTTTKNKSGNTVKFSEPNSYHEYRSRHKHTPPTKDINDNRKGKKAVETVILQQNSNVSSQSESSIVSETSSVENLSLENDKNVSHLDSKLKDADRIIIYKILESRNKKSKIHKKPESSKNDGKSSSSSENQSQRHRSVNFEKNAINSQKDSILEQLQEGVYKAVSSEGDNVTSKYVSEGCHEVEAGNNTRSNDKLHQPCCCRNVTLKANDEDSQKEGGDITSRSRNPNVSCYCGKNGKENSLLNQPSETTSSTSFKTAPNDKAGNINRDNEFIKLVDDGGNETGKFYIGASGFIKDNNYEVVIQLRKKDGVKIIAQESKGAPKSDTITEKSNKLSALENRNKTAVRESSDSLSNKLEEHPISLTNSATSVELNKVKEKNDEVLQNSGQQSSNKEQNENKITEPMKTKSQTTIMCEKAVHTSFEDTYAIPAHLPKSDPLPRPATSTYTQTSFNSSIQRPVFMHMSSSTSTAYMSPPELILPKFLKNDYIMTQEELFESENTVNETDPQYEVIEGNCEAYEECRCKRCINGQKITANKVKPITRKPIHTPPNTARSSHHCRLTKEIKDSKMRHCKCHKCRCSSETKICHKTHKKRSNSENITLTRDHSYEKKSVKLQSRHQKLRTHIKDNGDNIINPVVKKYVNKLLALNKEGLKAVEIMNQECSVASTPGSSIINLPSNSNKQQSSTEVVQNKISLEQIKNVLKQQILKDFDQCQSIIKSTMNSTEIETEKNPKFIPKFPKKKSVHKIKSLNISRQLLHKKRLATRRPVNNSKITTSTSSSTREEKKVVSVDTKNSRSRSKSSPNSRSYGNSEYKNSTSSDIAEPSNIKRFKSVAKNLATHVNSNDQILRQNCISTKSHQTKHLNLRAHRTNTAYISSDSEVPSIVLKHLITPQSPTNISTQTNGSVDVETNFMKLAEGKLQNMEKIADLTEKCTKRLSNLAKVLEEVRKNKSLVYSQISTSDSASESENKSDKIEATDISPVPCPNVLNKITETNQPFSSLTIPANLDEKKMCIKDSTEYIPFLLDIPKPVSFVTPLTDEYVPIIDKTVQTKNITTDIGSVKVRGRPPPALSRINLKNGQEISLTPHELSTVIEVDSPMSVKVKNQSSRHDTKFETPDKNQTFEENDNNNKNNVNIPAKIKEQTRTDPDLLQSNVTGAKQHSKVLSTDSSDDSKVQTMDLKQFNNIMLKPFITLQEFANQCNVGIEEGSNVEDVLKDDLVNEDLSSLHSDGSLPDVIAELLKRNIISEPFKFDTGSNGNSTTMSSESTLSALALSKSKKDKKKSGVLFKNKENIVDTSETLSISSNPDLENAFQKLGMGWASSTLKKTKERLALSSSSNTSSSSMAQFKIKTFSQVIPTLVTDSTSSLLDISNDHERKKLKSPSRNDKDNYKDAVQQTSLTNSMTVKEFLTNELAKKITFTNKSTRKEADEEFMSLYETNIPEDMKNTNTGKQEDDDQSTVASNNIRARTSTPVQIFKSTTYNSTSSSNTSNGLFSNADDLSSVKVTSTSIRNHSTSDKDDLTIPNYSLKTRKELSDFSKSD